MKIESLAADVQRVPLARPYAIAYREIGEVALGTVEIAASGGLVGRGSASPEPYVTGEDVGDVESAFDALRDAVVGQDARRARGLCREIEAAGAAGPAARAAVDMALCDLVAKRLGLPLVECLGRAHDALPTSVTIGIRAPEETCEEAREHIGRGFRVLKIKLGRAIDGELERLRRLRAEIPADVAVRVDANQAFGAAETEALAREAARLGVELVEQPMPAGAIEEARNLSEGARSLAAADESLCTPRDALDLLAPPRPFSIFNIKLMKCGGVLPALRIAELAELAGVELMWGCNDESRISIAAALHAALASPATRYLDLDGHLDLARDLAQGGFSLEGGWLRPSGEPGLGLTALD